MDRTTQRISISLGAFALCLSMSLLGVQAASAADEAGSGQSSGKRQHSPRDPASGQATGKRAQLTEQEFEKWEGVLISLDSLSAPLAAIRQNIEELQALSEQALSLEQEEAAEAEELLAQIDSASSIFTDQVAALLDPELAQQVSTELSRRRGDVKFNDVSIRKELDSSSPDLEFLLGELAKLEEIVATLEGSAQQGKSTPVTRSNISNN
ncbi:hypothetical protein IT575_11120 [bacterium]|nr:hypothetical protein [bacterium]